MRHRLPLVLALLLSLAPPANAQWFTAPNPDNLVCGAAAAQGSAVAVSDGAGGVLSVWNDARVAGHTDLFAQRINAAGVALWTADGVSVDAVVGQLATLVACSDDSSGMYVAWVRSAGTGANRVWAQRVDANGQLRWGASGVRVGLLELRQDMPRIVRDGSGGALVVWANGASGNAHVRGQRLSSSGTRLWAAYGDSIAGNGEVRSVAAVERPAGGVYVGWYQTFGVPRVAAVDANGVRIWNGGTIITNSPLTSAPPRLQGVATSDGVIFLASGGNEIYARGMRDTAAPWPPVRVVSGNWLQSQPQVVRDGADGVIIAWADSRVATTTLRAQRLLADGSAAWLTDGESFASSALGTIAFGLMADGGGGAWLAYGATPGTWAQHISSGGTPWLAGAGVNLSGSRGLNADGTQMVPAASSGMILVSPTSGPSSDIWAKRVFGNGSLSTLGVGDGPSRASGLSLAAGPNPSRDHVQLRFALPAAGRVRLELFGLRGERVALLAEGVLAAGNHARSFETARLSPGVYHARLTSGDGVVTASVVRVR